MSRNQKQYSHRRFDAELKHRENHNVVMASRRVHGDPVYPCVACNRNFKLGVAAYWVAHGDAHTCCANINSQDDTFRVFFCGTVAPWIRLSQVSTSTSMTRTTERAARWIRERSSVDVTSDPIPLLHALWRLDAVDVVLAIPDEEVNRVIGEHEMWKFGTYPRVHGARPGLDHTSIQLRFEMGSAKHVSKLAKQLLVDDAARRLQALEG